ncbi:hypothetical protein [Altericista sp. CCNU0014]|uniref:hypothetical protein n=1 Tax=Altericista sp. CCNU0014 TaxID=3082949 RepID=UPI00384BAEDD
MNWQDLIDNAPGRGQNRPESVGHTGQSIANRFGLDEYFQLRDDLGNQTILVVNFLDAISQKVPLAEAARKAAGLVAYANAPLGKPLPESMPNWPEIRARNGHPRPFGADYIQIGNEWWAYLDKARVDGNLKDPSALADWFLTCLRTYIREIRAVDPDVQLIVDGRIGQSIEAIVLADPEVRAQVKFAALHLYAPGPMENLQRNGQPFAFKNLSDEDWWKAWAAMPGVFSAAGENIALGQGTDLARSLGYRVAVTEWNWNGWTTAQTNPKPNMSWSLASGIGTAGFLNGLMRSGDRIAIACQSMLVGANWNITSIRIDPEAKAPPYFLPQGQMTMFYSQHHGRHRLAVTSGTLPRYNQPFSMGWSQRPSYPVADIDLVATVDDRAVYVHAINRSFATDYPITLNLEALQNLTETATHYVWSRRSRAWPFQPVPPEIGQITAQVKPLSRRQLSVTLPKQSASIIEIPFHP